MQPSEAGLILLMGFIVLLPGCEVKDKTAAVILFIIAFLWREQQDHAWQK